MSQFQCPHCQSHSCVEWKYWVPVNEIVLETLTLELICMGCFSLLPDRRRSEVVVAA
ncbi:MAG: hypothetical protein MI864_04925 [Pseudomonadales bacterium]|uniref:Uncharacterized protein n=1 Tax=Oleiphilus messinensis TaxID=141451 RepID=A0A1Y0I6U4_9GAMM|nr:hypothetical protein [Oleiphilus messinensis]ARU55245.1 hypothetical protein OLMES_1161 [Oleiphilus messinensis]MCG8609861.1 hypothetical protein [Pseudomonadales bacterium]